MSTQDEIVTNIAAEVALKLPLEPTALVMLAAFNEIGRRCYRAGFEQGVNISGQSHEIMLDTILKFVAP